MMLASFVGPVGAIERTVGTQTILNRISGYIYRVVFFTGPPKKVSYRKAGKAGRKLLTIKS